MTEETILKFRPKSHLTLEEALRTLIQGKREDPSEIGFLSPVDCETYRNWDDNGWKVSTGYGCFTNLPVLTYELPGSTSMAMSEDDAIREIQDESTYISNISEKIFAATGIDRNAGWEVDYIDGVDLQAEDYREFPVLLFFSDERWSEGRRSIEEFVRVWERYGLRTNLEFDETKKRVGGSFHLHPKGGFFLMQTKHKKEHKVRLAELTDFLNSLRPLLRRL